MDSPVQYLQANRARFTAEMLDLLCIPSVSALPEHAPHVQQAAEWVAARLRAAGIEGVRILPTAGHPVVYGEWLHAGGKPTILLDGMERFAPPSEHFMGISLVPHVPYQPIVRRVEDIVQRYGEFDGAQARREVTTSRGNAVDQELP